MNVSDIDVKGHPIELIVGKANGEIDLVGQSAESLRVCDSQGNEMLFEILDAKGNPKRKGKIEVGERLFFAVEIQKESKSRYFIYFGNENAIQVADFLRVGLENGGFEAGNGKPIGWEKMDVDEQHSVSWVSENPRSGKMCTRCDVKEGAPPTWVKWYQDEIPVIANRKYVLQGWVKAKNVKGMAGWFIHVHGEKPMMINRVLNAGDGTYDWREIRFEFRAPQTATTATVGTVLYGTGTAWYDDVSLEPIEPLENLNVISLKKEMIRLKELPMQPNWRLSRWQFRTIAKVFNFSDEQNEGALVFADTRKFRLQVAKASNRQIMPLSVQIVDVMPSEKARRIAFFQIKDSVIFSASIPPKSIKSFHIYMQQSKEPKYQLEKEGYSQILNSKANLVRNGDFEEGEEMPAQWHCSPRKEYEQLLCIPKRIAEGFVGKHCIQLEIPKGAPLRWSGWRQEISVKPNTTYFYSGFIKAKDVRGTVTLYGHFKDRKNRTIGYFGTRPELSGTTNWTQSYTFIRTPPDCIAVELHLTMNSHGTVWHDGILLCEVVASTLGKLETPKHLALVKKDYIVWEENPIVKVFPDDPPKRFDGKVRVYAAKNEHEPFQLVLRSQKDLHKVKVFVTKLVNKKGASLPDVKINLVGYVPIDYPSAYYSSDLPPYYRRLPTGAGATDGFSEEWADPLPPYSLFEMKAERNQPLWFTVKVPADAEAGEYFGKVIIEPKNAKRMEIPLQVIVWNFILPTETHLKVIFDLRSGPGWNIFANKDERQAMRNWYKLLASYRINLGILPQPIIAYKDGKVEMDTKLFDEMAHYCFHELRMNVFYTPWVFYGIQWAHPPRKFMDFEPFTNEYNEAFKKCYTAFMEHLKKKGWHDKVVYYISDEPHLHRKEVVENLKKLCDLAHSADKDVPIYSSTWRYSQDLKGYLDIWGVGQYGIFTVEQIQERLKAGDEIWFTTDGQMAIDTPFLATERLLPYLCFKYGVSGYEFWGISWWTYNPWERGWHKYILQSDEGERYYWVRYPNGDGYLTYPGEPIGLSEPVSSIRLEQVREGIEDYEYLHLLREAIKEAKKRGFRTDDAEKAIEKACSLVSIPNAGGLRSTELLPNPDAVLQARMQVAKQINKIRSLLQSLLVQ